MNENLRKAMLHSLGLIAVVLAGAGCLGGGSGNSGGSSAGSRGSTTSTQNSSGSPAYHEASTEGSKDSNTGSSSSPKSGGQVVGPCTLEGNIRDFEVTCTKEISNIQFLNFSSGKSLTMSNSVINGTRYDVKIAKDGDYKVKGYERSEDRIDFTLVFVDNSTASITVWE